MPVSKTSRLGGIMRGRPLVTAVVYVLVGILPLYLTSSQIVSLQQELGFGAARLGIATALHFGVAAAASHSIGLLIERAGAQMGLRMGAVLSATAAWMAVGTRVWWLLLAVTALGGIANGFMQVSANVYLARDASFRRQGLSFGAKQGAIPLGNALAGVLIPVVGVSLGWRLPYVIGGTLAVLAAVMAPTLVNADERRRAGGGEARPRLSRALLWMAIGGMFGGAAGNSLALFVVPWVVYGGSGQAAAGLFLAWSAALVFVLRVGVGWLADRRESSGHPEMASLLAFGAAACVVLATSGPTGVGLAAMALAMLGSWGWPALAYFGAVRVHPEAPARASGMVMSANLTGTMLGPMVRSIVPSALASASGVMTLREPGWAGAMLIYPSNRFGARPRSRIV